MKLDTILTPTAVATPGMLMRDVFKECVRAQVPSIPFRNEQGMLAGRIGLRDTMKRSCLPEYMVEMAHVLGNQLSCIDNAEQKAHDVLCHTVDDYVQPNLMSLTSSSTVIKTLAIMEKYDTTYVFIVDDGEYKGVVTTLGIAQRMIELDILCEPDNENG